MSDPCGFHHSYFQSLPDLIYINIIYSATYCFKDYISKALGILIFTNHILICSLPNKYPLFLHSKKTLPLQQLYPITSVNNSGYVFMHTEITNIK